MNVNLTNREQKDAISEFSEIIGFYIAFEEGNTVKERAESFAKRYPVFSKIREQIINGECDVVLPEESQPGKLKINGKKKPEPVTIEQNEKEEAKS